MTNEEIDAMRERGGLAQIASDVLQTQSGSYDRPPEHQVADINYLRWKLQNWKEPTTTAEAYVRALIAIALAKSDPGRINHVTLKGLASRIAAHLADYPDKAVELHRLLFPEEVVDNDTLAGTFVVYNTKGL